MIFGATCCVQLLAIDIAILHQTTRKTSNARVRKGCQGFTGFSCPVLPQLRLDVKK